MSIVHGYIKCMVSYRLKWLGLRFIYPLIWWLDRNYKGIYKMTKKHKRDCWGTLILSNGFLQLEEEPKPSFNLTSFHKRSLDSGSDSN